MGRKPYPETQIIGISEVKRSNSALLLFGGGLLGSCEDRQSRVTITTFAPYPPRSAQTSPGSIVHNLPGGIRLRESAGSIELLGDPRDEALEQLVTVAKQRFGTKRVTLLGTRSAQERLAQLEEEQGSEIAQERKRCARFC